MRFASTFAAIVLLICLTGCPNAYRAGWVSTAAVMNARDATDDGLTQAFNAKVESCVKTHHPDQIKIQSCVTASKQYEAASKWTTIILPAVNTSIRAASAVLEIAEKVNGEKQSTIQKVFTVLKEGLCKLVPALKEWVKYPGFPDALKTALGYAESVKGLVCK